MSPFHQFEITKREPYRFIGRCVYIGNKGPNRRMFDLSDYLWEHSDWVFAALDGMDEYVSDEVHNAALVSWEKYDEKNALYGYYIGRFMKAGAPVPGDMDYFDVDEQYFAAAWKKGKRGDRFGSMLLYGEGECKEEIERTGLYQERGWVFMAEVYSKPDENGDTHVGIYIPCAPKGTPAVTDR